MSDKKNFRPKFPWPIITLLLALGVVIILIVAKLFPDTFNFSGGKQAQDAGNQDQVAQEVVSPEIDGQLTINNQSLLTEPKQLASRFTYDSGVEIAYPEEGVKGIYLSGAGAADPSIRQANIDLIDQTGLNAVVLDVKDDYGSITMPLESDNQLVNDNTVPTLDSNELMQTFADKQIYPIARITTFKDTNLAQAHPERSFRTADGSVWTNDGGDAFLNPYQKENWDYLVEVAIGAAKLGFKDIQFDYVRFPEGFETFGETLQYDMGDYSEYGKDSTEAREAVISDFLAYAREKLRPYGVDVSADIFGYVTIVESTPGIGQNFRQIADEVDVISSMIYPSHWSPGYFGFQAPDLEPYGVVDQYMEKELTLLDDIDSDTITRPWLQDFTASYLGSGNYMTYDANAVQAQIDALQDHGVNEYLLWNAGNEYSQGVDYK
ncbi:putative glycoside hydrolase [Aerococcus kribbianus]|uniref:Glycoside hydrolase n=1 Tax=Aerococcus kribbianus TaxID=2999064 RepID=A0A9X3JFR2_9LACT|nr:MULTISPECIES: putative glycoside hydrolase [unclassified Aerococcus]MCZ0717337.1 putative glycoside hydrolase [Aerococcus sp. YH-aer221]MCZ0725625.1 putative glycoside hydrolase [Aerococcus sp. YH-aer222]